MLYDEIGRTYTQTWQPDPRIAAAILQAVGNAAHVLSVGAGTGRYEPEDRLTVAVEPSWQMIHQRRPGSGPAVCGRAEALPFRASPSALRWPHSPCITGQTVWEQRFGYLRELSALDVCYRLLSTD